MADWRGRREREPTASGKGDEKEDAGDDKCAGDSVVGCDYRTRASDRCSVRLEHVPTGEYRVTNIHGAGSFSTTPGSGTRALVALIAIYY
jgi:hypothetical protein